MPMTDEQRRWYFAHHPEFRKKQETKGKDEAKSKQQRGTTSRASRQPALSPSEDSAYRASKSETERRAKVRKLAKQMQSLLTEYARNKTEKERQERFRQPAITTVSPLVQRYQGLSNWFAREGLFLKPEWSSRLVEEKEPGADSGIRLPGNHRFVIDKAGFSFQKNIDFSPSRKWLPW